MGVTNMPMTPWEFIIGLNCGNCGKPATHFYGFYPLCCQCHGGDMFSEEETYETHANWYRDPHYIALKHMFYLNSLE
jgi:hypothetical protein